MKTSPLAEIQEKLRQKSVQLGFCNLGFTPLYPSSHGDYILQWFQKNHHGTMDYLARNPAEKINPQLRFPWAKSAIMLAFPYGEFPKNEALPLVARYARGEDYHHLIEKKLKQLKLELEQFFPELQSRLYVDTGPIIERELAQQAGLGFIGKNTLLIHRYHGSYFFLAAILTDIPFQLDQPMDTSHCGTCTRCLEICPTKALTEYQMDASKCISYLTIEKKGELTNSEMEGMGEQYFGCDLCQEVCPFNRKPFDFSSELSTPHPLATLNWEEILTLEEQHFETIKPKSPLRRSKRAGLIRNAIVVLANLKEEKYSVLIQRLKNSSLPGVAKAIEFMQQKK